MRHEYDLLIKNGHVIDAANDRDGIMDVAITGEKIARVGMSLEGSAAKVVDARDLYVTPGLIDIHTHVYPIFPYRGITCVNADDHLIKSGCTTTVDAGSVGWRDFLDFKKLVLEKSVCRVFAYLNICDQGMIDEQAEQYCKNMHPGITAEVIKAFPEHLVGVKSAHYRPGGRPTYDKDNPAWGSVDKAVEAAALSGTHTMVDFGVSEPESPYGKFLLEKLRPGDIHTHVFAQQFPTIDESGKLYEYMWEARAKGVLFDMGHGAGSFWFRNGCRALEQGFPPDTISTDLHTGSIRGPALSMLHCMGKYHNMGMPLYDAVKRSTWIPAKVIGHQELGTLTEGNVADIAILEEIDGEYGYIDNGNAKIMGHSRFDCRMTIIRGQIVFDICGMSMPLWQDAPRETYWRRLNNREDG